MEKPTLLVLAAGMGSRYGGLKQIDPLGPDGEIIIDYSLYDARLAGFDRVVFVIKEELQEVFEEKVGRHVRPFMQVEYAFQKTEDLPEGFAVPAGRVKPWGTGHAVRSARHLLHGPFGVINADDFYGRQTYQLLYDFLKEPHGGDTMEFCMVGYILQNTLTENGTVSRGICQVENGLLQSVTGHSQDPQSARWRGICPGWRTLCVPLDPQSTVSMNVWGFGQQLLPCLEEGFRQFLQGPLADPLKAEYYLPAAVDGLVHQGKAQVQVLRTASEWFGVTYPEDKQMVKDALRQAHEQGLYPALR